MAPLPFFTAISLLLRAKLKGTKARIPFFFAHKFKVV